MDQENGQNGHGNGKVYVPFGPRATQEIPIEWAGKMLTMWRESNPVQFGKMLAKVVTENT